MTLGGRGMRKCLVVVIAILALAFTSLGSAASSSRADTGRSVTSRLTSTASGQCSMAAAIEAVRRLGLSDVSADYPVWKVLCGAFTGAGSQTMVAIDLRLGERGDALLGGLPLVWNDWQFVMKQRRAAILTAAGSDIRETVSIYRPATRAVARAVERRRKSGTGTALGWWLGPRSG